MKKYVYGLIILVLAGVMALFWFTYINWSKGICMKKTESVQSGKAIIYELPKLPYAYDALEPYIDAKTMEIHYTKHHQSYINKLNEALAKHPQWQAVPLDQLLQRLNEIPEDIRMAVRNQGGGTINHTFFWQCMTPNAQKNPSKNFMTILENNFESFEGFKKKFNDAAVAVFGSGWAWLVQDQDKKLKVISTPNQDSPLMQGFKPLLGLDVWEHAYYLKYQNRRPEYIDGWWNVVNWNFVEQNYDRD
jgi:superoxide dismutase, Fe-Mn family